MSEQYSKTVEGLRKEVETLPKDIPTRTLWMQLTWVLGVMCGAIDDIHSTARKIEKHMADLNGIGKYTEREHPGRRKEDQKQGPPERIWFIEKVLPGLVQTLITTVVVLISLLIISHSAELKLIP